jgi:hypothetical protein
MMSRIDFRNNSLSGTFPTFLARFPVISLLLGDNQLTGTLPDWSHNTALTELQLDGNKLHGLLPGLFAG